MRFAKINRSLIRAFVFFLTLLSVNSDSLAQKMSSRFILKSAPVVTGERQKDLVLFADKPKDKLIRVQKRSAIEFENAPYDKNKIRQLFIDHTVSSKDKKNSKYVSSVYNQGFRVFNHFVDGMISKNPFDKLVATDEAQFWYAVIPKDVVVTQSILQMEWFGSGAGGHAQIRLKLNSPILLIDPLNLKTHKFIVGDMVYTLMAIGSENGQKSWGPLPGLTGVFANTYMLASTQHMAHVQVHENYIEQYTLKFDSAQNQRLLEHVLVRGSEAAEKEIYNLVYNSCIHAALRAINAAGAGVDTWLFNPYLLVPHLQSFGWIDSKPIRSFNDEFQGPQRTIETPENKKALEFVNQNIRLIQSDVFQDSVRLLAQTVIEDRWTFDELQLMIQLITDSIHEVQLQQDPINIENVISILRLKIKNLNNQHPQNAEINKKLQAKADRSIRILTIRFLQILNENNISMDQLMTFLLGLKTQN